VVGAMHEPLRRRLSTDVDPWHVAQPDVSDAELLVVRRQIDGVAHKRPPDAQISRGLNASDYA
jgi:hypothetical protein